MIGLEEKPTGSASKIRFYSAISVRTEKNPALFALSLHPDGFMRKINMFQSDRTNLTQPATCGIKQFQDGSIPYTAGC
jgi:hypothetical protein